MLSIARVFQMALKEDCWKNIASVYRLQISEITQTWNEDGNLAQMMKDLVEVLVVPKIQWSDQFLLRICQLLIIRFKYHSMVTISDSSIEPNPVD